MIPEPDNVDEVRREAGLDPPQPARERIAHAWRLTIRYWLSPDWKFAWGLLAAYIALQAGSVYLFVWANQWQRAFFDSIQNRQAGLFVGLAFTFAAILMLQVGYSVIKDVITWTWSIRWRRYLTEWYTSRWFARDRFYEIERLRLIDNPDQRIAEDIKALTAVNGSSSPPVVLIGLFTSLAMAISFGVILLETSRSIHFSLAGYELVLPGDMIWYAILYVLIGTFGITWIGKPYIRRRMREQHYEGDFRTGLMHVRRNAEQVAFAATGTTEKEGLRVSFERIRANYMRMLLSYVGLTASQGTYDRISAIFPLFMTVPRFFAGQITFGQVMAARDAFTQFASSLSYIIQAYPGIATQVANINRLKALDDAIDMKRPRGIDFAPKEASDDVVLAATGLALNRPHGAHLLTVGDWTVRRGERWIVQGPSGAGKTTLLRAIAGLWPDGRGQVRMDDRGSAMLVPQRLYLPQGTLKDALCFPDTANQHADGAIVALLEKVGLDAHVGHMHEVRFWQDELSPGEQQRVALVRILLHRPDMLVLDEATSALDPANATLFYEAMLEAMPNATIVSVVHNDKLARFHTHRLAISDGQARGGPVTNDGLAVGEGGTA